MMGLNTYFIGFRTKLVARKFLFVTAVFSLIVLSSCFHQSDNSSISSGNGTLNNPYIGSSPLTHSKTIGSDQAVYYLINRSGTGAFDTNLSNLNGDIDLIVLDSSGFELCVSLGRYAADESCSITSSQQQFLIVVYAYESSSYSLSVDASPILTGTWGNPVIAQSPFLIDGILPAYDAQYYQFNYPLDQVNSIELSSSSVDLAAINYPDLFLEPKLMCGSYEGNNNVKTCNVYGARDAVIVEASSFSGGSYTLQTQLNYLQGQGTSLDPYLLSHPFWFEADVLAQEEMVFLTQPPVSSTLGVSMFGLMNNADLKLINNSDSTLVCESVGRSNGAESCVADGSDDLKITVSGIETTDFKLRVQPDSALTGTWGNPLQGELPFSLQSNFTEDLPLYYLLNAQPQTIYQATGSGELSLWDRADIRPLCEFDQFQNNSCFIATASDELFLELNSYNYDFNVDVALVGDGTFYTPYTGVAPYLKTDSAELYEKKYHVVSVDSDKLYKLSFTPENYYGWGMKVYDGLDAPTYITNDPFQLKPSCNWSYDSLINHCYTQSPSGLIFVELNGGAATSYSLTVDEVVSGDGSSSSPFIHNWSSEAGLNIEGTLNTYEYQYHLSWLPKGQYALTFDSENSNGTVGVRFSDGSSFGCSLSDSGICLIRSSGSVAIFEFFNYNPGAFSLSLLPSEEIPQTLEVSGSIPYSDISTISLGNTVFYRFNISIGGRYLVTLGNLTADANLYVYGRSHVGPDPADYSGPASLLCASVASNVASKTCDITTNHTEMIVAVQGQGQSGYVLDVIAPPGSIDVPYIGTLPYQHNNAPTSADIVHYSLSVTPGENYLITVESGDGLSIIEGEMFICSNNNIFHLYCQITPSTNLITVKVYPKILSLGTLPEPYELLVKKMAPPPYSSAGDILIDQIKQGSLTQGQAIAYNLETTGGNEYVVTLSGLNGDADLLINDYGGMSCSSRQNGILDEVCQFPVAISPAEIVIYAYETTDYTLTVTVK